MSIKVFFDSHKHSMSIAKKKNPALWEKAKREACRSAKLCKHSARKMQWATRYYKSKGGTYVGKKSKSNSLSRWSKQKWRTSSGRKSDGKRRYLPDKAWKNLSKREIQRTNRAKARGYKQGKQFVAQPKDIARKTRRYRTSRTTRRKTSKARRASSKRKVSRRRRSARRKRTPRRRT